MELIFIRHGETEFNKHHQVMGQKIDADLDGEGLAQAKAVLAKLPEKVEYIFSSPLKRAAQTAQIVSEQYKVPVNYSDLLKERDFGSLSGKTWEQIDQETGAPLSKSDKNLKYDYQPYGGESVEQVKGRLQAFLAQLKNGPPVENVVVVTHYGIIMLMNELFPRMDHEQLNNSSVHHFQV